MLHALLPAALASLNSISGSLLDGPTWSAFGGTDDVHFGASVAQVGDVDGDGYQDLVVGCPLHGASFSYHGRAFLFRGVPGGTATTASWDKVGTQVGARFGSAVVGAGDVDADGFPDVVIGAPLEDVIAIDDGTAYLYRGGAAGLTTATVWPVHGAFGGAQFGATFAAPGDVDGDGYADLLVGAPAGAGSVRLYRGSASGLLPTAAWSVIHSWYPGELGTGLAGVGDLNGDGAPDIAIGAPDGAPVSAPTGFVRVYAGAPTGLGAVPAWVIESWSEPASGTEFGAAVAGAGDVDGDGFDDVLIGEPSYVSPTMHTVVGRALLHRGAPNWPSSTPAWSATSTPGSQFGRTLAGLGDVDGDGFDDWAVGATEPYQGRGLVQAWLGDAASLPADPQWSQYGALPHMHAGTALAAGRDLDGDGDPDLTVGSAYSTLDHPSRAETFSGGSACGPSAAALETVVLGAPANPMVLLHVGASSGPVIGRTWDPHIDHASFVPLALVDYLAVGAGTSGIATPHGTLLVNLGAQYFLFSKAPTAAFAVPVPDECALVGVALRAQAASLGVFLDLGLTNALDVVIGTY